MVIPSGYIVLNMSVQTDVQGIRWSLPTNESSSAVLQKRTLGDLTVYPAMKTAIHDKVVSGMVEFEQAG